MKTELLAPAGSLEKAMTAILYGADAVYVGGQQFSLRTRASNFTLDQIRTLVDFAKDHQARVYVTVNIIPHDEDQNGLEEYLLALDEAGIDAIIASSPGIIRLAHSLNVGYELHLSTQRTTLNHKVIDFYKQLGVNRVVLARENSLEDIQRIADHTDVELEVFVHGGMCVSYSGRCKLSNYMTNRDANRGGCAQSCRWNYIVEKEGFEDVEPFSMGSTDLNALEVIEDLVKMGVRSLKIEGRMKSNYYLATVVGAYRELLDLIESGISPSKEQIEAIGRRISQAEKRRTESGFLLGEPDVRMQIYPEEERQTIQRFLGRVLAYENDYALVEVRNRFDVNSPIEMIAPGLTGCKIKCMKIENLQGEPIEVCNNPMQIVRFYFEGPKAEHAMLQLQAEQA